MDVVPAFRREHLIIRLQVSPGAVFLSAFWRSCCTVLFIGDDWAEDHHDIELEDEDGRRLVRARLPEGLEGIARLHALVAEHARQRGRSCHLSRWRIR